MVFVSCLVFVVVGFGFRIRIGWFFFGGVCFFHIYFPEKLAWNLKEKGSQKESHPPRV